MILLARFLEDGEVLYVGFGDVLPVAAGQLARRLHAPSLTIVLPCGAVNPAGSAIYPSPADFRYLHRCEARLDGETLNDLAVGGGADVAFLTGVEIDQYGNVNQVRAGAEWSGPAEGAADAMIAERAKRSILYLRQHSSARLVEKVAHLSLVGHVDGRAGRPKCKIETLGPVALISDLGVFDFDDENCLRLRSVHAGREIQDVADRTAFMLQIAPNVGRTESPTAEELEVLRNEVDSGSVLRKPQEELSGQSQIGLR